MQEKVTLNKPKLETRKQLQKRKNVKHKKILKPKSQNNKTQEFTYIWMLFTII